MKKIELAREETREETFEATFEACVRALMQSRNFTREDALSALAGVRVMNEALSPSNPASKMNLR